MNFKGSSYDHLNILFFWSTTCYEFIPIWIFEQFLQEYHQKVGWKKEGDELVYIFLSECEFSDAV